MHISLVYIVKLYYTALCKKQKFLIYVKKTSSYLEVNTLQVGYGTNGRMLHKEINGCLNRDHLKKKEDSL